MVKPDRIGQQENVGLSALRGMDWNLMGLLPCLETTCSSKFSVAEKHRVRKIGLEALVFMKSSKVVPVLYSQQQVLYIFHHRASVWWPA